MRVLHVTPTYVPAWRYGGPIRSVHGLCSALVRLGVEVHVFTTTVDGPNDLDVPMGVPRDVDGVNVWYFRSAWFRRLYFAPEMGDELRAQVRKFDLLHAHSVYLWPTWIAARQARAHCVPYIVSPRGMLVRELIERKSPLLKKAWIALIERRNLQCAAAVHVTSPAEARELKLLGIKVPRVVMVPNGIDLHDNDSGTLPPKVSDALAKRQPLILYLGRINWEKGLDRLVRSLEYVPDAHLLAVGNDEEGYVERLESLAAEVGVRDRITFAGAVNGGAKASLFSKVALLVLPSYSESFGNVVLEAMAEGCPVIVTREVGAACVVEESGAGLVVEGSPIEIARAISSLLADPSTRASMGSAGRTCARRTYTWENIARLMLDHYRELATIRTKTEINVGVQH